jgi:drug/metabolite transporter superfamily protein YnfA
MNEPPLGSNGFDWTPRLVCKVAVRAGKPWWWALLGSALLVVYGFIPTLQPLADFGRLYAVYGGIFIVLSYWWGVRFDGFRMDRGDAIGSMMALVGVGIALFWPRS